MKLKKIPYYLAVGLLTCGASLILGLLSFGGMYAMFPILGLAFAVFGLSVAYEGEIYLQNIKGALTKIFKTDYLSQHLAKRYLLTQFPENLNNSPPFFQDYKAQLDFIAAFGHQLDANSKKRKQRAEKILSDMEKRFALMLFKEPTAQDADDTKNLRAWLANKNNFPKDENGNISDAWQTREQWQTKLTIRRWGLYGVLAFSFVAGGCAALGTTYLLVEAIAVIPFLAALGPASIVPIAVAGSIIAGVAYGLLVYNAITDFINNETIVTWYNKIREDWRDGFSFHNVVMALTTVTLILLAGALTVCTAGTWWTVVANARPLFEWMKNIPFWIINIIQPAITGFGSLFFIIQNTSESIKMVDEWLTKVLEKGLIKTLFGSTEKWFRQLRSIETWFQIFNPFRILLKLTVTPIRLLLFLGHLISIALTADRMPGIPHIVSFLVAIISEGFEDAHYFLGHTHSHPHTMQDKLNERLGAGHGHSHDLDIPTLIIKVIASPLYLSAALYDWGFSQRNENIENVLSFNKAWEKHWGNQPALIIKVIVSPLYLGAALWNWSKQPKEGNEKPVLSLPDMWDEQWGKETKEELVLNTDPQNPLLGGTKAATCYRLEKEIGRLQETYIDSHIAQDKANMLAKTRDKVLACANEVELLEVLNKAAQKPILNAQRFVLFPTPNKKSQCQESIEALPQRFNLRA